MGTVASTVTSFIVGSILGGLCTWFKNQYTMTSQIRSLVCANAQDRIVWLAEKYVQRGYITVREKALLKDMYRPYRKLGWNSYAEEAMGEVEKLPMKKGENYD